MAKDENGYVIFDNKEARARAAQVGAHEDLHVVGNRHENDPKNKSNDAQKKDGKNNLGNDTAPGKNVLPSQRSKIIKNIESQQ